MRYFAYGSNMASQRLKARVPSATPKCRAILKGHTLKWHKASKDGSGKCDAFETQNPVDQIWGMVFDICADEQDALDKAEGVGFGYEAVTVTVVDESGQEHQVFTYRATKMDETLIPYYWYKEHVLRGAKEHGLPADYTAQIETFPAKEDPKPDRRAKERAIYQDRKNLGSSKWSTD